MNRSLLATAVLVSAICLSGPCSAQSEPSLPSWNWDNPLGDPTPWAPSTITFVEVAALGLALDFYFGGRVSSAIYRAIVAGGRALTSGPIPAPPIR